MKTHKYIRDTLWIDSISKCTVQTQSLSFLTEQSTYFEASYK